MDGIEPAATAATAGAANSEGLVGDAVRRPLEARWAVYEQEVRRLVDATYRVVERTGSLDPTMRDILRESGLSNQAFYRHFRSKDELLVALLDDGRRRMAEYLEHRMSAATDVPGKVAAWIEGVLAQAGDPVAAARTRPFVAHQDRLAELFPTEQRNSVEAMVRPLREALATTDADALAVYRLTLATLHDHLRAGTAVDAEDTAHTVRFALAGLGLARD
ncbi:TetR/AcrR family transcriptional regulator [Embleya sp. NBC_00896]|uniref:TetR/AcrR family transcriptional regulator n=1 Tax=Embleya sp. NBC_00896 TaxID=2975961 RepID=UPI002F90F4C9|nr:TetR family transcriptional regulator [Embleya sp. NBC_00896]